MSCKENPGLDEQQLYITQLQCGVMKLHGNKMKQKVDTGGRKLIDKFPKVDNYK